MGKMVWGMGATHAQWVLCGKHRARKIVMSNSVGRSMVVREAVQAVERRASAARVRGFTMDGSCSEATEA
jgi:hypothetical protein